MCRISVGTTVSGRFSLVICEYMYTESLNIGDTDVECSRISLFKAVSITNDGLFTYIVVGWRQMSQRQTCQNLDKKN